MRVQQESCCWLLVVALFAVSSACARRTPRPNVLLVTIDTLRAVRLGCYGSPLSRTPRPDRMAAEGLRATNVPTVAPITFPAHTPIMPGLYPPAHGVRDNGA